MWGWLDLDGDLVFDGALVDGHPAFSPPDFGVEEAQKGVAQDDTEVGGDDSKGQGETELPQSGMHNDVVMTGHQSTVGCADTTGRGEVLDREFEESHQARRNEIVARSGVDEGGALAREYGEFHIHQRGCRGDKGFARTLGRGEYDFVVGLWEVLGKARK